jgi:Domain of unknown function (DUF4190)
MKFAFPKNPLVIIATILALISSIGTFGSLPNVSDALSWATAPENQAPAATWLYMAQVILTCLATLALLVFVFSNRKPIALSLFIALAFLGLPANFIGDFIWMSADGGTFNPLPTLWNFNTDFYPWQTNFGFIAQYISLVALGLYLLSALIKPKPTAPLTAVAPDRFDPMTGQPIAAPVAAPAGSGAQSNLPMIALILAFFVPLAAVIVGHISLNQMKQGLISSANQGMAKAGLILGYVFIGLGFLFGIIFAVVYASILSRQYY